MSCLEKKSDWLLLLSVIILVSGIALFFSLNFFEKIIYIPIILLYIFIIYFIFYIVLKRKNIKKAHFSVLSIILAVFMSTPIFYLAAIYTYDMVRTQIISSVFLNEIYKLSKLSLKNILFLLFLFSYIATYIFFKNLSDIFELKYVVEKYKNILNIVFEETTLRGVNLKIKVAGILIGTAIALVDIFLGNKFFLFFIPLLFFSKISILISVFTSSLFFYLMGIRIDVFWNFVAIFLFSLFLFLLSKKLAISIEGHASAPLRLFLSALSILIFLVVFFIIFQIKAVLLVPLYLLLIIVVAFSIFELENNNIPLSLLAVISVSYMMASGSNGLAGVFKMINPNLAIFYWFFITSILAIQTATYVTYIQRKLEDYTYDCHIGIVEAFIVLVAASSIGSIVVLNPPSIDFNYLGRIEIGNTNFVGIIYPLFSLIFSVAHFFLTAPLVTEGLIVYGFNPFHPVGVFIGGIFPGPSTMIPSIIAIALKIADLKLKKKLLSKLFSYSILGLGLGYLLGLILCSLISI